MLDQPVPNPLAKNPNFHTHKVFAAIGIILIVIIMIGGGIWYYLVGRYLAGNDLGDATYKTATASAKTASKSADTSDWKTYTDQSAQLSLKYPTDWDVKINEDKSSMPDFFFSLHTKNNISSINLTRASKSSYDEFKKNWTVGESKYISQYVADAMITTRLPDIIVDQTTVLIEQNLVNPDKMEAAFDPSIKARINSSENYYIFIYSSSGEEFKTNEKTFYQILATFKFL